MSTPSSYQPGQVLTAAELNASFDDKTDNTDAAITGGTVTGITLLEVIGTTASTSPTTGAATVAGGLGVAGAINAGGNITANGQLVASATTDTTSPTTGSAIVSGGLGVAKSLQVGASVTVAGAVNTQTAAITSLTDSTSPTTGAETIAGGLGVAKSMYIGGNTNVAGNSSVTGNVTAAGTVQGGNVTVAPGGVLTYPDGSTQATAGAVNGELAIPTTGGTVTITATQAAANSIFNVTGSLTANVTLVFPATPKVLTVANNTTNAGSTARTLTVTVAGQTPSATVAQGKAATLYTDATGAYATSAASGFQFSGQANDSTGLTYDITYSGKIVYQTASGIASKMPTASSFAAGAGLAVKNTSAGTTTLAAQSGDSFDDGLTSPVTLQPNDCLCYVSDGVSQWHAAWYSNHVNPKFTSGITFPDGTTQTTANSTTQPASQWYVVGPTDTVGSFADGDTAIRTAGFTAPFVDVIKNGLVLTRGQHFTLNADGIHINFTDPLINNGVDSDQLEVKTKAVYNPSSTYAPSLPWITPAAGATFIAYPHVVGFAWLMLRGAFLQAGTDYTEDATGFYLVGFAADGVEQYGVFNLNAISIANALNTNNPVIASGPMTFADGSKQGTAAIGRNRIINGDFRVNQRNGASGATPALGTSVYLVDRWYTWQAGAACLVQTVPNNPNYGDPSQGYYMRATGVAGNTSVNFGQRIESVDISDLVGKVVTLSFSTIRTLGGIVAVAVYTPTANDNWAANASSQQIANFTLTAGSWYRQVVTFTVPAGAKFGLQVEFDAPNLIAGDYFAITDVQLESGNNPTPIFERRPYRDVLSACQRYFYNIATSQQYDAVITGQTNGLQFAWKWPVTMRVNPAIATNINTSTFSNNVQPGSGQWNAVLQSIAWLTVSSGTMTLNTTPSQSGGTIYTTGAVFNVVPTQMALGTGIYLRADAEL